jgi:hypothetical protein
MALEARTRLSQLSHEEFERLDRDQLRQLLRDAAGERLEDAGERVNPDLLKDPGFKRQVTQLREAVQTLVDKEIDARESEYIQIFVQTTSAKHIKVWVELAETVDQLRQKLQDREGIPADQQRLIFQGKQLDNGNTLQSYSIMKDSTVAMALRLPGGGRMGTKPPPGGHISSGTGPTDCIEHATVKIQCEKIDFVAKPRRFRETSLAPSE